METIEDLLTKKPNDVINFLKGKSKDTSEYLKQYDPQQHKVKDPQIRKDKPVKTESGTSLVEVARLPVPFQKLIVDRAASFLIGEGVGLIADPNTDQEKILLQMLKKTWYDNKLDYKTREIARLWMSETECAEYWWFEEDSELWQGMGLPTGAGKAKMNTQVWAKSKGDLLCPVFDEFDKLKAFGRGYKVGKKEHFDLFTETELIYYRKDDNWTEIDRKENLLEKIPVIYYNRDIPEWHDAQDLIERFETLISNFADRNDYFGSPLIVVKGRVTGFAEKGEQGKMITAEQDAEIDYLTWDQAPESIKLEKDTLQELIFSVTQTPDISFQQMKGLGANISGIALELMFLDAMLKALKHQEIFGEMMQRRINLLKKGMTLISTSLEKVSGVMIEPEFTFYMPRNLQEQINMLVTATGGRAIMSRKTAVENNPFVVNSEAEFEDIKDDEAGDFGNILPL